MYVSNILTLYIMTPFCAPICLQNYVNKPGDECKHQYLVLFMQVNELFSFHPNGTPLSFPQGPGSGIRKNFSSRLNCLQPWPAAVALQKCWQGREVNFTNIFIRVPLLSILLWSFVFGVTYFLSVAQIGCRWAGVITPNTCRAGSRGNNNRLVGIQIRVSL